MLYSKKEMVINRDHPDYPASAVLEDIYDGFIFRFDEDMTDDQIWLAVSFCRHMYDAGLKDGARKVQGDIRQLLGIDQ